MKPVIRTSPLTQQCSDLLDATLPLLVSAFQSSPIHIVSSQDRNALSGEMRRGDGPRPPAQTIELNLTEGTPKLERISPVHVRLCYRREDQGSAAAALLAGAATPHTPIAGDNQSLALCTLAERLGASDIPVLIGGPSGTGKEVFARFLHRVSARNEARFVAVNCAAMPEAMLEALLFGHKKGAFTGASDAGQGLFRAADKGTLLLDEIGEMPVALQAKLLRALQEGEVLPLGATQPIKVDVRVVACTNRELSEEVAAGRFREDLFYRLNVFPMRLPALRERPGDIAPLAFGMMLRHSTATIEAGWISDAALARLQGHAWPGNVRELENVIRRAILLCGENAMIEPEHIQFDASVSAVMGEAAVPATPIDAPIAAASEGEVSSEKAAGSLSDVAFRSEAQAIIAALDHCGGHRAKTAKHLGISERTLRYRLASMRETGLLSAGATR